MDEGPTANADAALDGNQPSRAFTCVAEPHSSVTLVRLAGALDVVTAVQVRAALHKALAVQPSAIVVDLAGMTVSEGVALTVFTAFANAATTWPGCPLLLCAAAEDVAAELNRLAIGRVLPVHPDRTSALRTALKVSAPLRYSQRMAPAPAACSAARALVAAACRSWRLREAVEDAELIVTELVSNAVRHGHGALDVRVTLRMPYLHISVEDAEVELPARIVPNAQTGEGGRGLLLLDAVATAWGSLPVPPGKVVWATLRVRR